MNILVVADHHPDDEVLGCGGTFALHAWRGDIVAVLILGEDMTSHEAERTEENVDRNALFRLHSDAQRDNCCKQSSGFYTALHVCEHIPINIEGPRRLGIGDEP